MGLPFRRQPLGKFLHTHKLTHVQVADALGCHFTRVNSLIQGRTYPTAREIAALEALFSLPIEVLLESALLKYHKVVDR